MKVTLIIPNVVSQKGDLFGTGIPYMPIIPAYLASYIKKLGQEVKVIDAFGSDPTKKRKTDDLIISGMTVKEIVDEVDIKTDLVCIYAGHVIEHQLIIEIIKSLKVHGRICVIENSQAVTAYALKIAYKDFLKNGADFVITGEPELPIKNIIEGKTLENIGGVIFNKNGKDIINDNEYCLNLDEIPFPDWGMFKLVNYWKLHYSHGPYQGRYMPLLTSRGCPYGCEFCVIPFTNNRKWRCRSAKNIFEEIKHWHSKYKVTDFHIEDLNPTLDRKNMVELCNLIIGWKVNIRFKFVSGVKLDTLDEEMIRLLAQAGCNYLSFSPETGSKRVLKLMKKPFDHEHGIRMTRLMNRLGIITQACFVIGFPGENSNDLRLTKKYAYRLTKEGVDEIALFIMTPIPGSKPYEISQKPSDLSKLTFSPKWRKEYKRLNRMRTFIYLKFAFLKCIYHPIKSIKHPINLMKRNFQIKIEMTLYRVFKTHL